MRNIGGCQPHQQGRAIFLDTQEQSMMIFTDLFPYAEGAKPFLDQEAVVGSGSKD